MPEALAVAVVMAVVAIAWIGAWLQARTPVRAEDAGEVARRHQHAAWLEQRQAQAEREGWEPEMIDRLRTELAAARGEAGSSER